MDKYKRYYGVAIFCVAVVMLLVGSYHLISPKVNKSESLKASIESKESESAGLQKKVSIVQAKLKQIKDAASSSQKKIYAPTESSLDDETLFFTLYNDVIEMLHTNSVKIKAIDYVYNPEDDSFVKAGNNVYFVCDINMELVSNYVNLGKLVQDIYQYPYYIRINKIEITPYAKDKKVLLTTMSLRLYAHTAPQETEINEPAAPALDGASARLPQ